MQIGPALLILLMTAGTPGLGAGQQSAVLAAPAPVFEPPRTQPESPPALAAKFGVSTTTAGMPPVMQGDWYLLRGPERIERVRPDAGVAEIWERDDRGDLSLKRVYRNDARVVEYTPGNLRAMHLEAHWESLGAAVDPRRVRAFRPGATADTPFGRATVFVGVVAGVATEVWWLDELRIPVRVIEQRQEARVIIDLKALHTEPPPDWPHAASAEQNTFETIDVSDLGDRHYDPFVRKVETADAVFRAMPFLDR